MPLRLDLIRHGEALPSGVGGDAARPLSERGRQVVRSVAEEYRSRSWRPEALFSSPLLRARQTAEIVLTCLPPGLEIQILPELEPEGDVDALLVALEARVLAAHAVLVGHQPLLGRLAAHLIGTDLSLPPGTLLSLSCRRGLRDGAHLDLERRPQV